MSRNAQRGAALLAMLAVLVMGATWWLVSAMATKANRVALERSQNGPLLRAAKQALIGYVAQQAGTNDLNPGALPCPEAAANIGTVNEGIASGTCTLPAVGRLPWRTLGIEKLYDAAGEPLWYIVSTGWAKPNNITPTLGINSNSRGNLTVDGQANAAVALIVAPGAPITLAPNANQIAAGCVARAQVRTPNAPNPLDYLECQNIAGASLRTTLVDNTTTPIFNDQAVAVSAAEVLAAVEPVVAKRIERDVVPTLAAVYNTAPAGCSTGAGTQTNEWGVSFACPAATTTNPVFPFAAPYSTTSGVPCAPVASDVSNQPTLAVGAAFKGAGCTEGLLPVSSQTCNAMTNGPCDTTFGTSWNTATISVVRTGGTATTFNSNCSTSTAAQVTCTITFSRLLCLLFCSITADVTVQAKAPDIGNALKGFSSAGASGLTTLTVPLQGDGAALATYSGTLSGGSSGICGSLISVLCSGSATVIIPITIFQDHAFVSAAGPTPGSPGTAPTAWFWFLVNKWHHVTYYAVAPLHAPGGAGDCAGANCISVTVQGGATLNGRRSVLALAGRSLQGSASPNRAFGDFLDTAVNTDLDRSFEQNKNSKFFNDRFVSLSP